MKFAIGSDHAGYLLKEKIKDYLNKQEIEFTDFGTFKEESSDYPEYAYKVGNAVVNKEADMGILICGTGMGMCISVNKIKGIRAAVVYSEETAQLSRLHNNTNIVCLGSRTHNEDDAVKLLNTWMNTSFEGGRHEKRIDLINKLTGL